MLHLGSLASAPAAAVPRVCGTHEAHDLCNLLATLGIHLETPQRCHLMPQITELRRGTG
jgi:hypothetical protein